MGMSEDSRNAPKVWVDSATFSDDTTIHFDPTDIVVFVGPNNVGKSVALKNIYAKIANQRNIGQVVTKLEIKNSGEAEALIEWLETTTKPYEDNVPDPMYESLGAQVQKSKAMLYWNSAASGLSKLVHFFVRHLSTYSRLNAADPAPRIALLKEPISHPIHYLERDPEIEERVSRYFRQAFSEDLILHRNAGKEVPLYCGQRPILESGEERISRRYLRELEKLPTLQSQGDGMRSFVGVLLHAFVAKHCVILIDEPEAFLHPSQARLLGHMLVEETPKDRQLFIATHSGDFLRGLLDMDKGRVKIIRIQRNGSINIVKELNNKGIQNLWEDALLRYSNVLDGLFHSKVIVCESDSDCRFYAAVKDVLTEEEGGSAKQDLMFVHGGGKGRLSLIIGSLHSLDVDISVIADFDILNSDDPLSKIWLNLGGNWKEIDSDWKCLKNSIDSKGPQLSSKKVVSEIEAVLKNIKSKQFPKEAQEEIQSILRQSTPWSIAKTVGKDFAPRGNPSAAYKRLMKVFNSKGLFIVPVGELESFVRSVGGHGSKWVSDVLKKNLANDPEFEKAKSFVRSVLSS